MFPTQYGSLVVGVGWVLHRSRLVVITHLGGVSFIGAQSQLLGALILSATDLSSFYAAPHVG